MQYADGRGSKTFCYVTCNRSKACILESKSKLIYHFEKNLVPEGHDLCVNAFVENASYVKTR